MLGTFAVVPLIANNRIFNAAFALGAEGVYCVTAFLMTKESRMADELVEMDNQETIDAVTVDFSDIDEVKAFIDSLLDKEIKIIEVPHGWFIEKILEG